jgi:KaiC/GvpD/RAD55 family RecA-like ATPase
MVMEGVKELGITQESYEIVTQELTTTAAKERQNKELAETLQQAAQLTRKGSTQEALDLLTKKTPQLQGANREQEYSKLLLPASLESDRQELQGLPQDLQTSYIVTIPNLTTRQEYPILLPGGGLTVVAGQTGHGKTTLLINLALDITKRHPDRRIVYITYEEQETIIRSYFLNTYIGQQLNNATSQAKGNKAVIKEYLRTGQTQYVGRKEILETKAVDFYNTYITSGRLQVKELDYPIRDLAAAIRYLHHTDKSIAGIFIDYFQLLHADAIHKRETGANNRQEELKQICIMLKDVATQTGLPLILGAQFNRQVDSVIDLDYKAIGEAGDIERIANTILGIYDIRYERRSNDSKAAAKAVADRIGERETGLYLEVLKSRYMPRGGQAIYDYDSNTGVINPIPAQW